ncbi:carbohydrate binding domain-containing protein, partial [Actinocrinis sp.]|uniref:carbohydrate binding domain-containing protein n=1 Tax=Actinocrinis sp. TaxID=1920516 RepID=UPI0039C876AB
MPSFSLTRRRLAAAAAMLLAGTCVVFATHPAAAASPNLLADPGFESGLTGWTCSSTDTTVSNPVHGGTEALAGTPAGSDYAQCSQAVSVLPNSSYSLSAWVQGSYVYLGDTGTGTTDTSNWTPSATSWTQLSTSFTTGASTTSVTVYIHGWYGQPTFYADD